MAYTWDQVEMSPAFQNKTAEEQQIIKNNFFKNNWKRELYNFASSVNVPPPLAHAVALTESGGQIGAISPEGARGLMQVLPSTGRERGKDVSDPQQNIEAGVGYLGDLLTQFKGNKIATLAAYNAGPGRVQQLQQQYGTEWFQHLPSETKAYVPKILKLWQQFKQAPTTADIPEEALTKESGPSMPLPLSLIQRRGEPHVRLAVPPKIRTEAIPDYTENVFPPHRTLPGEIGGEPERRAATVPGVPSLQTEPEPSLPVRAYRSLFGEDAPLGMTPLPVPGSTPGHEIQPEPGPTTGALAALPAVLGFAEHPWLTAGILGALEAGTKGLGAGGEFVGRKLAGELGASRGRTLGEAAPLALLMAMGLGKSPENILSRGEGPASRLNLLRELPPQLGYVSGPTSTPRPPTPSGIGETEAGGPPQYPRPTPPKRFVPPSAVRTPEERAEQTPLSFPTTAPEEKIWTPPPGYGEPTGKPRPLGPPSPAQAQEILLTKGQEPEPLSHEPEGLPPPTPSSASLPSAEKPSPQKELPGVEPPPLSASTASTAKVPIPKPTRTPKPLLESRLKSIAAEEPGTSYTLSPQERNTLIKDLGLQPGVSNKEIAQAYVKGKTVPLAQAEEKPSSGGEISNLFKGAGNLSEPLFSQLAQRLANPQFSDPWKAVDIAGMGKAKLPLFEQIVARIAERGYREVDDIRKAAALADEARRSGNISTFLQKKLATEFPEKEVPQEEAPSVEKPPTDKEQYGLSPELIKRGMPQTEVKAKVPQKETEKIPLPAGNQYPFEKLAQDLVASQGQTITLNTHQRNAMYRAMGVDRETPATKDGKTFAELDDLTFAQGYLRWIDKMKSTRE